MLTLDVLRLTVERAIAPLRVTAEADVARQAAVAPSAVNPARLVQRAAAAVAGVGALPGDLVDAGVAMVTAGVSAPALPAAVLGSLYIGMPHAHGHPPSMVPPAPPVPLPSVGAVMLGGCPRVLIRGVPAVRAGDLGIAPTCGGLAPLFEVVTGSSKVFIGGARAARVGDLARCCQPAAGHGTARGLLGTAGAVGLTAGAVADATDAMAAEESAVARALALSAAMAAAQAVADAAIAAARAAQGSDPAIGPSLGALASGCSTVLIGGLPMPNVLGVLETVIAKIRSRRMGRRRDTLEDGARKAGCPDC